MCMKSMRYLICSKNLCAGMFGGLGNKAAHIKYLTCVNGSGFYGDTVPALAVINKMLIMGN